MTFPLNLDDDMVIRKQGRFQLEVVNLFKKVPAAVLIRPRWKAGDEIDSDRFSIVELEPDDKQVVEIMTSGLHVVHWIIARPGFFAEVRKKHLPKDGVVVGPIIITSETEAYLRVTKAKPFVI